MQLSSRLLKSVGRRCGAAGTAAILLCLAVASQAQGTTNSPVGTWDCFVSGKRGVGLANITFNSDYTFSGVELLTVKPPTPVLPVPPTSTDGRPGSTVISRGDPPSPAPTTPTNAPVAMTNLFGFGDFGGPWTYDRYGRVIGYFVEHIQVPDSTNTILHSIGFVAKVVPGRRLVLVANTPNGKATFNGVPLATTLPDLIGSWYGIRRQGTSSLVEFFTATPYSAPSLYTVEGNGPGYTYSGVAMVSAWKRFGLAVDITPEDGATSYTRSVLGPYYPGRGLATTTGMETPQTRIRFNAHRN